MPTFTPTSRFTPTVARPIIQQATVTLEPTQKPTQSPLPSATPTSHAQLQVNVDANIRYGPGTNYPVIGSAKQGEVFEVVGKSADQSWWELCCVAGKAGWIYGQLIQPKDTEQVAIAQAIPPTPLPMPPIPIPVDNLQLVVHTGANIRTGPGTDYPIVGSAQRQDTFTAIGTNVEGSWWSLCCINGNHGWIYTDLVQTVTTNHLPALVQAPNTPETAEAGTDTVVHIPPEQLAAQTAANGELGTILTLDNLELSVLGWEVVQNTALPADANHQFIAVDLVLKNRTDHQTSLSAQNFLLVDSQGSHYQVDSRAMQVIDNRVDLADLLPGASNRGRIGFQVPVGVTGLQLVMVQNYRSGPAEYLPIGDPENAPEFLAPLVVLWDFIAMPLNALVFLDNTFGEHNPTQESGQKILAVINLGDQPRSVQLPEVFSCGFQPANPSGAYQMHINQVLPPITEHAFIEQGYKLVMLDVTITNTTAEALSSLTLFLRTSTCAQYRETGTVIHFTDRRLDSFSFEASTARSGVIGFEVPAHETEFMLVLSPFMSSEQWAQVKYLVNTP